MTRVPNHAMDKLSSHSPTDIWLSTVVGPAYLTSYSIATRKHSEIYGYMTSSIVERNGSPLETSSTSSRRQVKTKICRLRARSTSTKSSASISERLLTFYSTKLWRVPGGGVRYLGCLLQSLGWTMHLRYLVAASSSTEDSLQPAEAF